MIACKDSAQIFKLMPAKSYLPVAVKLRLNSEENTLTSIKKKEVMMTEWVNSLLQGDFYGGTIPIFDTLEFTHNSELIFIGQEMRAEDESLEADIKQKIKLGMAYTYLNLMKVCNEICQYLLKMHTNHLVYLNIKPSHVLYSMTIDKYIVIDFGISENHQEKILKQDKTIESFSCPSIAWTPAYASPLAKLGGDHNPFKSDMFSLSLFNTLC